jgi:rhodanese-related sulfurtransferase
MKNFTISLVCFLTLNFFSLTAQNDPFASHVVMDAAALSPSELPTFEQYCKSPENIKIHTITPKELTYAFANDREKVFLLDVRSKAEYDISHIKDSKFIGFEGFTSERIWTVDRKSRVIIYSSTNKRGILIAQYLVLLGFTDVQLIEGGIIGWKNAGYDVYDANGKTDKIHVGSKDNLKLLHLGLAVF